MGGLSVNEILRNVVMRISQDNIDSICGIEDCFRTCVLKNSDMIRERTLWSPFLFKVQSLKGMQVLTLILQLFWEMRHFLVSCR